MEVQQMLKFISYSGKWPALCVGTVVVKKDGKQYELDNILSSGGCCGFNNDFTESYVETGRWKIWKACLPEELQDDYEELLDLVNDNIEHGCCGGCL